MPRPTSGTGAAPRSRLAVEQLEDRLTPNFGNFGGVSIAIGNVFPELNAPPRNEYVLGAGPGELPWVRIYSETGVLEQEFLAYEPSFRGGVNVAVGDINPHDFATFNGVDYPVEEIITGTGVGGGPVVKTFNMSQPSANRSFLAYEASFRGGVNVAASDLNQVAEPDPNNPAVSRFRDEIVTGSGPGGGPLVKVFHNIAPPTPPGVPRNWQLLRGFFAYESTMRFGVNVTAGDIVSLPNFDGNEIATGPGIGGAPLLKVFTQTGQLFQSFFAFDFRSRNGLVVAAGDTESRFAEEVFAVEAFTPTFQDARVRSFSGNDTQIESDVIIFPAGYTNHVNLATGPAASTNNLSGIGDVAATAGDGAFFQVPRLLFGAPGSPAGNNGP